MPISKAQRDDFLAIARMRGLPSSERTASLVLVQKGTDLPFAPESTNAYAGRSKAQRAKVAKEVGAAKDAGASGDEIRALFGCLLSGPARRKLLREHAQDAGRIAPSYDAYRDGDTRVGTRHAREHGADAAQRRADEEEAASKAQRRAEGARKAAATRAARRAAAAASAPESAPES